jgi:hypothetical protein
VATEAWQQIWTNHKYETLEFRNNVKNLPYFVSIKVLIHNIPHLTAFSTSHRELVYFQKQLQTLEKQLYIKVLKFQTGPELAPVNCNNTGSFLLEFGIFASKSKNIDFRRIF